MIKKSKEIFFSTEKGLTSTQANHLANIAKELYQTDLEKANGIRFVSSYVTVAGTDKVYQTKSGASLDDYKNINLGRIGLLNTFCAWVREAIKAKDEALQKLDDMDVFDYMSMNNLSYTEVDVKVDVTDEDAINNLSIEDRVNYYSLEAKASVLGKQIHPGQSLSIAINEVRQVMNEPVRVKSTDNNDIIEELKPTADINDLEAHFLSLQAIHRKLNGELNVLKQKIKDIKTEMTTKLNNEKAKLLQIREQESLKYRLDFNNFLNAERDRIGKLKIIIPDELQDIYKEICSIAGIK